MYAVVRKSERSPVPRLEEDIRINLTEIDYRVADWIQLAQDKMQ